MEEATLLASCHLVCRFKRREEAVCLAFVHSSSKKLRREERDERREESEERVKEA